MLGHEAAVRELDRGLFTDIENVSANMLLSVDNTVDCSTNLSFQIKSALRPPYLKEHLAYLFRTDNVPYYDCISRLAD